LNEKQTKNARDQKKKIEKKKELLRKLEKNIQLNLFLKILAL